MSFLNPVSLPVKRFKSTDAGAPQINYNARTVGDVKAVLKACLVTGYGAVASAGWTAANEVENPGEYLISFISPDVSMSDYRFRVSDTPSTTYYYYAYQGLDIVPTYGAPTKSFGYADLTHANNGWQVLVTDRGLIFIELVQHSVVNKLSARITYWGAVKSAIASVTGRNICFFNLGHNAAISYPNYFYSNYFYVHTQLETHTNAWMSAATSNMLSGATSILDTANVDLVSPIYLADSGCAQMLGELPPMLSKVVNKTADLYGISEQTLDARSVLSVCAGYPNSTAPYVNSYGRTFLIRTDYWEY